MTVYTTWDRDVTPPDTTVFARTLATELGLPESGSFYSADVEITVSSGQIVAGGLGF